jgi:hypothetical protein
MTASRCGFVLLTLLRWQLRRRLHFSAQPVVAAP